MKRVYHSWHSKSLDRKMEMLVFGHAGAAVLFFPTRSARFFDYENWGMIASLKDKIESGHLQVYCLDSIDQEALYGTDSSPEEKINRHLQYERYILEEVLPLIRIENPDAYLISAGCSLGAFHALNIAFKYPHLFNKVLAMSGRYDLTQQMGSFQDLLSGYRNETIYYNSPNQYLSNMEDPLTLSALRELKVIIVIGRQDAFLENNFQLDTTLWNKQIAHEFYVWDGEAHKPKYWKQMLSLYL
jgi:esterase/lipase superfamily enzyme